MNLEGRQDGTITFRFEKWKGVVPQSISTAFLSVLLGTSRELIASTPMTVSEHVASLEVPLPSGTFPLQRNYMAEMIIDGVRHLRLFDVVRTPFVNEVVEQDLIDENPDVLSAQFEVRGEAESGTVSTLVDSHRLEVASYWMNGEIQIFPADGAPTRHRITGWDYITGTISFSPALAFAITTEGYALKRSMDSAIARAGEIVQGDLWKKDRRPALIIDGTQLNRLIVLKVFERFFAGRISNESDVDKTQFERYRDEYAAEFASMALAYDANEDGFIDPQDARESVSVGQSFFRR